MQMCRLNDCQLYYKPSSRDRKKIDRTEGKMKKRSGNMTSIKYFDIPATKKSDWF